MYSGKEDIISDTNRIIKKELALIKIYVGNPKLIPEIRDIANIGTIIDESMKSMVIEITGTSEKIVDFINNINNSIFVYISPILSVNIFFTK